MATPDGRGFVRGMFVRSLLTAAGLSVSVWGCASKPKADSGTAPRPAGGSAAVAVETPRYEGLTRLAQRQERSPDKKAMDLPAPPGADSASLSPLGPDAPVRARKPLADVLQEYTPAPSETKELQGSANQQALRLYASGRSKLLEGEAAKAVTDLEAAARLDPNAPEVWRELGQAQLELGRRTSAMTSFQKAHKLGIREPRVVIIVAREDLRGKRYEEAARKLTAARGMAAEGNDLGAMQLLDIDLAESLGALGYLGASRDLLESGLKTPVESIAASPLRNELAEVLRRRGDLWQRAGDISFRLGEYGRAATSYAEAADATALDPQALVAKQVYALLKQGKSAEAALVLVDDIRASEGRVEDRHMAVISYLAQNTEVGPRLADAMTELARAAGPTATPTVLNRLARATAAALTGDAARAALRSRIAQSPFDTDLVVEVLGSYAHQDMRGRVKECLALTAAAPIATEVYAGALLNRGQGIDASVAMLETDRSPAARLLYASLVSRLGRPDLGLQRLEGDFPAPFQAGGLALRASCAAACGNWETAREAEQNLAALKTPQAAEAHALTLKVLQQFTRALDEVDGLIKAAGSAPATEQLLLAGELAMRCDQPAPAEGYLRRALERDRFDERVYEPLISIYMAQGPLADEEKLTSVARQLRQNIPSSRVIRGINAQETLARGLWSQAEQQLFSMLTENNENGSVMNLLVTVWERAAKPDPDLTAKGEKWLRDQLAERPESTLLLTSLARVLAAEEKGAEAEPLLAARLAKWPIPDVARMREWVVREALKKPEDADRLALERLEAAPKGIDNSIEYAELLVHKGEVEKATRALVTGVPTDAQLTKEQTGRLAAVVLRIEPQKLAEVDPKNVESALHLLDLIAGRVPMGDQQHRLRLVLLTAGHYNEPQRLIEAAEALAKVIPDRPMEGYVIVLASLETREDVGPAARFAAAAANHIKPALGGWYLQWLRVVGTRGSVKDVDEFAENLKDPEGVQALLEQLARQPNDLKIPEEFDDKKAEVLYQLGSFVPSKGREPAAEEAYRLCLKLNPNHAMAANNLGYDLLERGVDMKEAERLIRAAYAQKDDDPSVVDSMGWLLYKLGHIEDVVDKDGNITQVGAVSLLAQAVGDEPENPTLSDHYADALWRTGTQDNREQAKVLWQQADALLGERISAYATESDNPLVKALKGQAEEDRRRVQVKLEAARDGREVPVAALAPGVQVQNR